MLLSIYLGLRFSSRNVPDNWLFCALELELDFDFVKEGDT